MAARDVLFIMVILFAIGIGFFIIYFVMNTVLDSMILTPELNETIGTVQAFQGTKTMLNRLDYVVFGLLIGLTLGLIITGWFIAGNPIFMFIYFIVIVMGTIVSTILSNVWESISQASAFGTTLAAFPITNFILLKLPFFVAALGFIGMTVMFAKPYFQQQ